MARKLVTLLAALFICMGANAEEADAPKEREDLFNYVCEYAYVFYNAECGDLQPPTLVTSRVVSSRYYGFYYPGETYIFINKQLWLHDMPKWESTVVHETMHYVLDWTDADVTRCESEEYARRVHHTFEGTEYNDSWRTQYRC